MSKKHLIGLDIETYLITNQVAPKPVCVTLYSEKLGEQIYLAKDSVPILIDLLRDENNIFVAHNAQFDFISLAVYSVDLFNYITLAYSQNRIFCSKLSEILLNSADPATEGKSRTTVFIDRGEEHQKGRWFPASSNTLMGCAWKYLDINLTADKESDNRLTYGDWDGVPLEEWAQDRIDYAIGDAKYCHDVLKKQGMRARELRDRIGVNVLNDLPRQSYVEFVLQFSSTVFGVGVDVSKIDTAVDAVMQIHDQEIQTALSYGLFKPSKTDRGYSAVTAKMQEMLQRAIDLVGVEHPTTKKGTLSTTKLAMETLYDAMDYALSYGRNLDHKLPLSEDDMKELAGIQAGFKSKQAADGAWKEKKTFLDALRNACLNPDQRLRYTYNGLMETGRTSSKNPNLQNIPRKGAARSCIKPAEGSLFIIADYSNAELRTLAQAHINEDRPSRLAVEYQKDPNFDPHLFMAVNIIGGMTYEEGKEILKDKTHALYAKVKENRQLSKIANFGYAGGLGAEQFIDYAKGYGVSLTSDRSKELRDQWLETWSEMEDYFRVRGEMLQASEEADILDRALTQKLSGKARKRKEVRDSDYRCIYRFDSSSRARYLRKFTIACNTPFQGIASDGAKDALILIWEECFFTPDSPLYGCIPVLFVHDEVVLQYKFDGNRERATAAAKRVQELMEQGMANHTPDIPAVAEPNLSWEWTKDAESEWLEDGTLSIYGTQP